MMKNFWSKIRNWALVTVLFIGAVADFGFGLVSEIQQEYDIPGRWVMLLRIAIVGCALASAKLQTPSNNPEKLERLASRIRIKRARKNVINRS